MAALGEDLLVTVNKLQDLVFNTIGNDSLDLPQIVGGHHSLPHPISVLFSNVHYAKLLLFYLRRSLLALNLPASPLY